MARWTAHLSVFLVALVVLLALRGIQLPPSAWGGPSGEVVYPQLTPTIAPKSWVASPPLLLNRAVVPDTTIPPRPRASVITYTVQPGDSLSSIAQQFGLSIWTIIWSNREAVWDAPWLIQPGLTLYIPPVDGVYHTVREGETIESIAEKYGVSPSALFNEWNNLKEGQLLQEGMQLMVVGGRDKYIDLVPPPPKPVVRGGRGGTSGVCQGVGAGIVGTGWFIYPTGSARVSGWYFYDRRNPGHIGLDYACRLGDPIYAADHGVVTIAGWNGGYGILVELNHGNGFTTRYAHLSELAVGCGQSVYQGQIIGYCGSTGWSSGPHLHFEIRYLGVPQNPQGYLP
ncbi:MAG: peptidoglycan DD-metalloendopeptidase family protein [Anaerolineae bacterium]|nr:peptidoglycan DD-metalloendopeptidase family protein [Anaerolineae bacterium]MDW7991805.1 peptidoglycan DD-metalloendopeptidase family protein [Anaerolineae bacterium]